MRGSSTTTTSTSSRVVASSSGFGSTSSDSTSGSCNPIHRTSSSASSASSASSSPAPQPRPLPATEDEALRELWTNPKYWLQLQSLLGGLRLSELAKWAPNSSFKGKGAQGRVIQVELHWPEWLAHSLKHLPLFQQWPRLLQGVPVIFKETGFSEAGFHSQRTSFEREVLATIAAGGRFSPGQQSATEDAVERYNAGGACPSAAPLLLGFEVTREAGWLLLSASGYSSQSLSDVVDAAAAQGSHLVSQQVLSYAWDVACGLAQLHSKGFVHADVKTANTVRTGDGRLFACDNGLSVRAGTSAASLWCGTFIFACTTVSQAAGNSLLDNRQRPSCMRAGGSSIRAAVVLRLPLPCLTCH